MLQHKPSSMRIVHPLLFALFPVIFLYAHNMKQLAAGQIVGALIAVPGGALLLWLALWLVFKNGAKAAIVTSFFLIAFFSYGHVHEALFYLSTKRGQLFITRNIFLMPLFAVVFLAGCFFVVRTRKTLQSLTRILNVVAGCLVGFSLLNIAVFTMRTWGPAQSLAQGPTAPTPAVQPHDAADLPNIYYIILDAYARDDVLQNIYQFDNSEFLEFLTGKGFYVARKSNSNYIATPFSLGAALNMRYLDDLTEQFGSETDDFRPVCRLLPHNKVFTLLRKVGYRIVSFATGFGVTELKTADIYLTSGWSLNEFETLLLATTPLLSFRILFEAHFPPFEPQRKRILYQLDHLKDTLDLQGPLLVFDHIICPHPPFRFGPEGQSLDPRDTNFLRYADEPKDETVVAKYIDYYRGQVQFINHRITQVVEDLLTQSTRPTVIILQADHGPDAIFDYAKPDTACVERLPILNAYYFPDGDYSQLYPSITPVNSFRVVFNKYLGTNYPLLQDKCYFHDEQRAYDFLDLTDQVD